MSSRYFILLAVAVSASSCLHGSDLYAIGLAPNETGARDLYLYRVDSTLHELVAVRKLASNPDFIVADLERSVIFAAAPMSAPTQIYIVDTRSPSETREVKLNYKDGELPYAAVEVEAPTKGLYLAFAIGRFAPPNKLDPEPALTGVRLAGSGSGPESIPVTVMAYPRVMGLMGDRFPESRKLVPEVRGNPLSVAFYPDPRVSMGMPGPPRESDYRLAVDNDEVAVLLSFHESRASVFSVFDKQARAWHELSLPFPSLFVRSFGYWLAFIGSEPAGGTREPIPGAPVNHVMVVRGGAQAGSADNRQAVVQYKTTVEEEMQVSGHNHSGQLLLSNQKSGVEYVIDTGEADSEIVQVTDEYVIYRVNDRLLKSVMSGGRLVPPTELATGDEVIGTHWIFEGPAIPSVEGKPR